MVLTSTVGEWGSSTRAVSLWWGEWYSGREWELGTRPANLCSSTRTVSTYWESSYQDRLSL